MVFVLLQYETLWVRGALRGTRRVRLGSDAFPAAAGARLGYTCTFVHELDIREPDYSIALGDGRSSGWRGGKEGTVQELWRQEMDRRAFLTRLGRFSLGVVGVSSAVGLLESCTASSPSPSGSALASVAMTNVKVQLLWVENIQFAGLLAAESQGFLKEQALTQDLIPGGPQVNALQAVAGGVAPIGLIGSSDAVIQARANGLPVKLIATEFQTGPFGVMSLASAPITSVHDLVGKKIGLQAGARPTFSEMLAIANIDPSTITVVPVGIDPTPLVSGQVDGYWASATGQPLQLKAKGIETVMLLASDAGLPSYGDVIFTLDNVLQQQEDLLTRWLRAIVKGWQYALQHNAEIAKYTVDKSPSLKLDLAQQVAQGEAQVPFVTSDLTKAKGLLWVDPATVAKSIDLNLKTGQIKSTVKVDDVVTTTILEKAYGGKTSL